MRQNVVKRGSLTRYDGVMTSAGGETTPGVEREEVMPIRLMRILLCQKMKKIYAVDSSSRNVR
jgi:hypothetical protein